MTLRLRPSLVALALLAIPAAAPSALAAPAQFEQTDVFVAGQDGVAEYRIPVLVTTKAGTLLAMCDARVERGGDPPNYVRAVMKRSTDGGRTWGRLQVLADPGRGAAVADSCGVVDRQTGTIWVFSDYCPVGVGSGNAVRGISGATVMYKAVRSDDDGLTWSAPIDFTAMMKKPSWRAGSFGPGKGIQMRNGRLVMPRYYNDSDTDTDDHAICFVSYSDDHGRTWQFGGEANTAGKTNECQVAEMADGSLLLNMRGTVGNRRKVARSRDGGATWSAVSEDAALIEPRCQGSLESYTDSVGSDRDRLLFSNPASLKRENLTVRLSTDAGRTWAAAKVIQPGPAAYSCLSILPDLTVGCLYERGEKKAYERITFAHFNLEWLTGGAVK